MAAGIPEIVAALNALHSDQKIDFHGFTLLSYTNGSVLSATIKLTAKGEEAVLEYSSDRRIWPSELDPPEL